MNFLSSFSNFRSFKIFHLWFQLCGINICRSMAVHWPRCCSITGIRESWNCPLGCAISFPRLYTYVLLLLLMLVKSGRCILGSISYFFDITFLRLIRNNCSTGIKEFQYSYKIKEAASIRNMYLLTLPKNQNLYKIDIRFQ